MSQEIINLPLLGLKCHPRNDEFFSNVEGEEFNRLKQSIQELGILTPLRVSADMTIISGHQRYRAAKELGFIEVPVIVDKGLVNDDEKVVQLIAANFGRMKNDPIKQGRWIAEYERLRGVMHGGNRKSSGNNFRLITQEDIAAELGVDTRTLRNLKSLNDIHPEFKEIISEGRISATTGFKLIARLSEDEQHELLSLLPEAQRFTQAQVQEYVDHIRELEGQNASLTVQKEAAEEDAEKWMSEAVEAAKTINESADSKRYMEMKNAKDDAEGKYRDEHEAFVQYRKEMAKQSIEWEKKLKEAEAKASRIPESVEVVKEVEVVPKDYEECKRLAGLYMERMEKRIQSGKVDPYASEEEHQRDFELRCEQYIEGFVPEMEGLLVEKGFLPKMDVEFKYQFTNTLERIIEIAEEMIKELNITKEVA